MKLLFLFVLASFTSFAHSANYGFESSCFDQPSDAVASFQGSYPRMVGTHREQVSSVSYSSGALSFTLSDTDLSVVSAIPVVTTGNTILLTDCSYHYPVANILLGFGFVVCFSLGWQAGSSSVR